ncbi:hypothetical protein [Stenotrophomonas maltophilia]|uniref:hypothetical protein n=1 Tax=Stenotrophomonas maltophilia TaxID=40324 RepID=UPI0025CE4D01|nr:hypothetical protein [uncultured Stenotrophomonas sp.]
MLMLVSLVLANLASLGIQFVIPRLLVPEEYTRFAMMWASGQLAAAVLFEWLRIGVVRYSASDSRDPRKLPETLGALYVGILGVAVVLAVLLLATGDAGGAVFTAGFILFYACAQGAFDGQQASLRADFRNVRFSITWMARSILSFILTLAAASCFSDGRFALAGLIVSFLVASVFAGSRPRSLRWPARASVIFLVKFGLFAAAAGMISFALPLAARYAMVHYAGGAESAGALLAVDIAQKILMALGTAINLVLLQPVIGRVNLDPVEGRGHMAGHLVNVVALFSAAMVVLLYANRVMVTYFVPTAFLDSYSKVSLLAVISVVLVCLKSYGLDALFAIGAKTVYSVVTSALALILFALGCVGLYATQCLSLVSILIALVLALAAGVVLAAWLVASTLSMQLPWAKLSRILLVTVIALTASYCLALFGGRVVQMLGMVMIVLVILCGYRALGVGGPRQWLVQS